MVRIAAFFIASCIAAFAAPIARAADEYPNKPVRIIVPFAPGGGTDVVARILAQKLSGELKQQFVVENKAGAGGSIGTDLTAKAPADGYTLMLVPTSHVINPSIYPKLPFNTERDFAPISMVASTPILVAVAAKVPAKSLAELVALARTNTNLNYGSAGNGTVFHLATEVFKRENNIQVTHVPYKGGAPVVAALIAGEIDLAFETMLALQPHVRSGRARALAVASRERSKNMPEVPTAVEQGFPAIVATNDYMLFAPAGTPAPVLELLYNSVAAALKDPDIVSKLALQGAEVVASTPTQLATYVRLELPRWNQIVKQSDIKAD
ncbi:hypothetical protein BWI17_14085 [Betaproteobacteria bacterium GR16-43]|nr:hypothetical protein BWI17_14085 [Betaproteobacteria bacterium GR16-43]